MAYFRSVKESGGGDNLAGLIERSITSLKNDEAMSVGAYAFNKNSTIVDVDLPNVTNIGAYGFTETTSLTTINLPKVNTINDRCFQNSVISEIDLPSLTTINGSSNFQYCRSLTSAKMPLATAIPGYFFYGCSRLSSVDFSSVINLGNGGERVFDGCVLSFIDLPVCTHIGAICFLNNPLTIMVLRSNQVCTLANINAFNGTPFASGKTGGDLYVPNDLISSYEAATNWSTILGYENNRILPIEGSIYENS